MMTRALVCILASSVWFGACDADAPSSTSQLRTRADVAGPQPVPHPSGVYRGDAAPLLRARGPNAPGSAAAARHAPRSPNISVVSSDQNAGEQFGPEVFPNSLIQAARARTSAGVRYDPAYRTIDYPMGDVPDDTGVCTDVIIRAYRALGEDLQARVHEDMTADFPAYPDLWGLTRPDPNIDHRRVPNLETYFAREGAELPVSTDANAYQPGDLVTYRLGGRLPHIAIVSDKTGPSGAYNIIHNIGSGVREEDALMSHQLHRRFRWAPARD